MKLLVTTQAVDLNDPVLGFFHGWVAGLAEYFELVDVICLREGAHHLPENVRVHSLGKPENSSKKTIGGRFVYAIRFLRLAWELRQKYDAVFVHMNQEYILIAGWLWKLFGKRIYLWRNHYAGSWLTDIAASFCIKVFCTSKYSYTAKYKKTVLMPVGVDTERFKSSVHSARKQHSILFLARMAPSKRPELLLDALAMLAQDGALFTATFVGSPAPGDESYYMGLKARAAMFDFGTQVTFLSGVSNSETPTLYRAHMIFVNTSPSGMLDKTLFEAAACGCHVLAASADFTEIAGSNSHFDTATELYERLKLMLMNRAPQETAGFIKRNSLAVLTERLAKELHWP